MSKEITKSKMDMVSEFAEKEGMSKKDANKFITSFLELVMETMKETDKLQLTGFGTIRAYDREAREGRNPRNPEEIYSIPGSRQISFRSGNVFKKVINGEDEEDEEKGKKKVIKKVIK